jgi:hypothetical protein
LKTNDLGWSLLLIAKDRLAQVVQSIPASMVRIVAQRFMYFLEENLENMEELWIYKRGSLGSTPLSVIEILESGLQTRPDQG